jgi:hypothetical protein
MRVVFNVTTGASSWPRVNAVTRSTRRSGGVDAGPVIEISLRTPGASVGSFTVHGSSSPRRNRNDAPARASRRSAVS